VKLHGVPVNVWAHNVLPAATLKTLNVRTNLVQLQTLNRPLQGLPKNKICIVLFVFLADLFFLNLFFILIISEFCFPTGQLCSTFSPFFLIFTCTEDGVVEKKKSPIYFILHIITFPS